MSKSSPPALRRCHNCRGEMVTRSQNTTLFLAKRADLPRHENCTQRPSGRTSLMQTQKLRLVPRPHITADLGPFLGSIESAREAIIENRNAEAEPERPYADLDNDRS